MKFVPCQGRNACREDDTSCLTCGRTLEEIVELRQITDRLSALAQTRQYDNLDDFLAHVAHKVRKKVSSATESS